MSVETNPRMATLQGRSRGTRRGEPSESDAPRLPEQPRIPGRRNPKWIALGVVAICLGGLLSYAVYARVASESTVLAMQHTVYRGQVIESGDLTTVTVNGNIGVPTVPATELNSLVGKRAAFDLPEDSILAPDAVNDAPLPAANQSLVGLNLSPGRQPDTFLVPGSRVRLIVVPGPNDQSTTVSGFQNKNYAATVISTAPGTDEGTLRVNVSVANGEAAVVALLAASDHIAVVRDADR